MMASPLASATPPVSTRLLRVLLGSVLATLAIWLSPLAELEEGAGLGFLYMLRGPVVAPQHLLIVTADASSSRSLGVPERVDRWPRRLHAQLIDGLVENGAVAIGFDLLFQQPREPHDDARLSEALRSAGKVVLVEGVRRDLLRAPDGRMLASVDERIVPLEMFAQAAHATAPFLLPKTPQGVLEFWDEIPALGDRASLPLLLARLYFAHRAGVAADELPAELHPGKAAGAARSGGRRILNLYGPLHSVATVGYADALATLSDRSAAAAMFGGKVVLVGQSEANQSRQVDAYRTPFSTRDGLDVSGVELCATAVGNLTEGTWLERPGEGATAALIGVAAALLALPWVFVGARTAFALTVMLALTYVGIAHLAFAHLYLWLPVVIPAGFAPVIAVGLGLAAQYRDARRERAQFAKAAELGIPARAAARLAAVLGANSSGNTVFAVCMCSDIEGYTPLSESLSPLAIRDRLNAYLATFLPVIEHHGGYAADIVGDSIMSVWIANETREAAFAQACKAALTLDRIMNRDGSPAALPTRFGLHCGPVFFGEVGGDGRRELRVVGDTVNTASRIQGVNKYLGTRILVSGEVASAFDAPSRRARGRFALMGKSEPLPLCELADEALPAPAGQAFMAGLACFDRGDFVQAERCFADAAVQGDRGPAEFYRAQCRMLLRSPPGRDWSGIIDLGAK
nr:adenylate/guanylate cyclase domain-containing protein [Zoogloeaceae bacterium]